MTLFLLEKLPVFAVWTIPAPRQPGQTQGVQRGGDGTDPGESRWCLQRGAGTGSGEKRQTLVYTAGRANSYKKSGVSRGPRGSSKSDSLKDSGKRYGYVRRIALRWVVGRGVR